MSQISDAFDPSMEEILSSIKRIISDEKRYAPGSHTTQRSSGLEPSFGAPSQERNSTKEPGASDLQFCAEKMEPLISPSALAASAHAFEAINSATQSPKIPENPNRMNSLEDFVADVMRPLLKDWLDQNLPQMVREVIQQEIKRVARF